MSSDDCSIPSGTQAAFLFMKPTCQTALCNHAGEEASEGETHQDVIVYLSDVRIIGWTHVKETQHWVLIFGLCVDGVLALDTWTGDGYMPVMTSDACSACLVRVCVCSATQALHEGLGTVLRPAFLNTKQSCCRAVKQIYIHVYIYI